MANSSVSSFFTIKFDTKASSLVGIKCIPDLLNSANKIPGLKALSVKKCNSASVLSNNFEKKKKWNKIMKILK